MCWGATQGIMAGVMHLLARGYLLIVVYHPAHSVCSHHAVQALWIDVACQAIASIVDGSGPFLTASAGVELHAGQEMIHRYVAITDALISFGFGSGHQNSFLCS